MSVIVAVTDGKRVCMACDSQATNNGSKATLNGSSAKIIRKGAMLFGSSHLCVLDMIRYNLENPLTTMPLSEWAGMVFVPWLLGALNARGLMEKSQDGSVEFPSGIFIGHGGEFVLVDRGTGIVSFARQFAGMGSGWLEAQGAMWQLLADADGAIEYMHDKRSADMAHLEYVATRGVLAACALDSACGPPVHVEWTDEGL